MEKPTEKQINLLKEMYHKNIINLKQYNFAISDVGVASRIIEQNIYRFMNHKRD